MPVGLVDDASEGLAFFSVRRNPDHHELRTASSIRVFVAEQLHPDDEHLNFGREDVIPRDYTRKLFKRTSIVV